MQKRKKKEKKLSALFVPFFLMECSTGGYRPTIINKIGFIYTYIIYMYLVQMQHMNTYLVYLEP